VPPHREIADRWPGHARRDAGRRRKRLLHSLLRVHRPRMRLHRDHHVGHLRERRCLLVPVLDYVGHRVPEAVAGSVHRDRSYCGTDHSCLRAVDLLRRGGRAGGSRARRGGRAGAVALGLAAGSHVGSASPWPFPGITKRSGRCWPIAGDRHPGQIRIRWTSMLPYSRLVGNGRPLCSSMPPP
jgi:hypothetical protein